MKIAFLDQSTLGEDINLDKFKQFAEVIAYPYTLPNQTLKAVQNIDIVVTNKVVIDKYIMDNSNIKLICVAATGMNNIDLKYAKEKGIIVKNVTGYSTASVVQLTFSYVFHFIQKLAYYDNYVKSKQWEKSPIFTNLDVPFYELKNKKWGIIGLGEIGENVANIAKSFGCEVSYYSTSGMNNNTNYKKVSLEELLSKSDIISIHCPLNDTTLNLINKTNLTQIKEGAILLNLGRGGIINEQDLADIIDQKELYCGIDVVTKEPIESTNPLNKIQNKNRIVITPHIAWASKESRERLIDGIVRNIKEFVL
jgi:glycerate dehydrogenase